MGEEGRTRAEDKTRRLELKALDKDIGNGYEHLACEREQLQRTLSALKASEYGLEDEQFLRDQLICAQATIAQQQMIIEQHQLQGRHLDGVLSFFKALKLEFVSALVASAITSSVLLLPC
ncbi:unnamed protein product [Gongylonema pulchrum]|uniref:GTD-binding domain-containing protein n=1 Tax=Gongylonema pulchrum TaxID=637853 RepID=A0A183CW58_9BILA|nr:unnamed protein product [Gongylonema pulchrum]